MPGGSGTTDRPTASSGPMSQQDLVNALANEVGGSGSSSSTGSKYGLGVWGQQTVNPGDLPIFGNLIGKGKQTTGDNVVAAFAAASPVQLAEMQRALFLGGFYGKTYSPSYGVISPEDIQAFGKAVTLAGQSGSSVSDLLLSRAKYGTAAGIAAAQSMNKAAASKTKVAVVSVPATGDLEAQAMDAFEKTLGRKAHPKEAAAFASAYQAMSSGIQRANALAEQQAVTQASGGGPGITAKEAAGFDQQLAQVGEPARVVPSGDLPHNMAFLGVDSAPRPGFGDQLAQLQTLGQSVTAAAAAKNPPAATGGGVHFIEEQQPEDASVAAANFARNTHPKAAAKADLAGALDNFLSLIGSRLGA